MRTRSRVLCRTASVPVLTLGLALSFAFLTPASKLWSAAAQVTSPVGSYGILFNQWIDSNTKVVRGFITSLYFDGAGNVSGPYAFITVSDTVITGTLTGNYIGNPDGSNTLNLTRDVGGTFTALMTLTDGGTGMQLLMTGGGLLPQGQVITGTGRIQSAQRSIPAGSYGYLLNQWPDANNDPQGVSGVFNLDGAGNVNGSYTVVGSTGASGSVLRGGLIGTYSVSSDGTGSMILNLDLGVTATFDIVVTEGGLGIQMLLVDFNGGGIGSVVTGTARLQ